MSKAIDKLSGASLGRRTVLKGALGALAASGHGILSASTASSPMRLVLGFSAGGGADAVARLLAQKMGPAMNRQALVENKPGAGGRIAVMAVKSAEADGSVLFFGSTSVLTLLPHVFTGLPYDMHRDFTPVSTACSFPYAIVVSPSIGVNDLQGLVAWAKANPDRAFFGTPGIGLPQHLIGSLLARLTGMPLDHLPFKSGGEAAQQLLGGQLPVAVATAGQFFQLHRGGRVKMIATTGKNRVSGVDDIPTCAEQGFPSMVFEDSFGFIGPAKMSESTVASLCRGIAQTVRMPEVEKGLKGQDMDPLLIQDDAYVDYLNKEFERWRSVVKEVGFTPNKA